MPKMIRAKLYRWRGLQAVRFPKDLAFPVGVRTVMILREGKQRVVAPTDAIWDDFFDAPGVDLREEEQPATQVRDEF